MARNGENASLNGAINNYFFYLIIYIAISKTMEDGFKSLAGMKIHSNLRMLFINIA